VKIYTDTSVLFSLYVTDANTPKADTWSQKNPDPLDFTGFHRLELRNALGLAVFQQRLTPILKRLLAGGEFRFGVADGKGRRRAGR
jgi:hypothetical protein